MPKLRHLTEYHKKAMEMKYKGNSYKEIAEFLNEKFRKSRKTKNGLSFTEQTIKDWFKESGTLCEDYNRYEEELDEINAETLEVIRKAGMRIREENYRLANEMLVGLMGSSNDSIKLAAIRELLDRVEGKPKQAIDVAEDDKYPSYEQIIRQLEQEREEAKARESKEKEKQE